MSSRSSNVPKYRLHKPSGRAVITLKTSQGRRDIYLGAYGSKESKAEYARVIAELQASPTAIVAKRGPGARFSVNEVLLAFLRHADQHYRRPDGTRTNEYREFVHTVRPVRELCGHIPAASFGPRDLKAIREKMIAAGWCRKLINRRVGRIRHVFKWATSEGMIPADVHQALATVAGLQRGRCAAVDHAPVRPVAEDQVAATCRHLRPALAAMVQVQRLTGMRPGELVQLRPVDIDMTGEVWLFKPQDHKNSWRDKSRIVAIGPRARGILEAFTPADPSSHYFDPRREVDQFHLQRSLARQTPRYPSHMERNRRKRVKGKRRPPAERYTTASYARAISRAVEAENARRERMAGPGNFEPLEHWSPHMLRHAAATAIREQFGLEAASTTLGHARMDVTEVYAAKNLELAVRVAKMAG